MAKLKIVPGNAITAQPGFESAWQGVRDLLTDSILNDFKALGAKQTNLRLNQSGKEEKLPVFIDWVALEGVLNKLINRSDIDDLGRHRLGETTPSEVYNSGLTSAGAMLIERDWKIEHLTEKHVGAKLLVQKVGLYYQKFIGIIAQDESGKPRRAGLLTLSFEQKPKADKINEIDNRMKKWASWPGNPKSELVKFIEDHFEIGGPAL